MVGARPRHGSRSETMIAVMCLLLHEVRGQGMCIHALTHTSGHSIITAFHLVWVRFITRMQPSFIASISKHARAFNCYQMLLGAAQVTGSIVSFASVEVTDSASKASRAQQTGGFGLPFPGQHMFKASSILKPNIG